MAAPERSAILLDVDGTLASIVRHADDALVPESTRGLLIRIARRYALVACVSGRRAADARRIVSIGSIGYIGNHGGELLRPGSVTVEIDQRLAPWTNRVQRFARRHCTSELQRLRVRLEDKGPIAGLHWRGAPDEQLARAALEELAGMAQAEGLAVHWGRKVLELRPPVPVDKGTGITRLLRGSGLTAALYAGDDLTDLDGFAALRALVAAGDLDSAVCVGVASDEAPEAIAGAADVMVDGPDGVRALLETLANG